MSIKINELLEQNSRIYNELAEKRTIERLGLTEKEVTIGKAFESTKAIELENIKKEVVDRNLIKFPKFFGIF